ncbi:protein phosphatase 2C domain-containing protein [Microbacterium sp.]|uniref:protein phosphatase 2C domain-containing protein n=1 Tax=Microbacterium sp. TaxID=51671 RepID=UPI00281246DB|nr:protein phosphatase 2C domain-containing protein [Microbacterium sp.]
MSRIVYSLPAEPGRESEDACAVGDGVAVVVDGAGLPKDMRLGCSHSVAWYARILAEAFRMRLEDRANEMTEALAGAIAEVTAAHAGTCDLRRGSPSATVAAWRIDGDEVEHLVLSDASIVLIGADGTVQEVTDDRINDAVERGSAELLENGEFSQVAAARFAALDRTRNVDGGFWCCQTDPEAARHAFTGRTPVRDLRAIVAASDGGSRGYQLLGAHSLERFGALAARGELARIAQDIRAAEDAHGVPAFTKPHDDIALVAALM